MSFEKDFSKIVKYRMPLAGLTTMGVGGTCEMLAEPGDESELADCWLAAREDGLDVHILGGGTNVVVVEDPLSGVVVKTGAVGSFDIDGDTVTVGAGFPLPKLLVECAKAGLSGLEPLAGIPGTVGGAITGNSGGRLGDIGSKVSTVRVASEEGYVSDLSREELDFGYRKSGVKGLVLGATLRLTPGNAAKIHAAQIDVADEKVRTQPYGVKSSGCVFKNPPGDSAGRLIDELGLKGVTIGGAQVSDKHANFIINTGGATADDIARLIERVRREVWQGHAVDLELEVDLWR